MAEAVTCPIAGPLHVTICRVSGVGPFARPGALLPLRPTRLDIVNTSPAPCTLRLLSLDPLQRGDTGLQAGGVLTTGTRLPVTLAPGARLEVAIGGQVPQRAGSYGSTLRIGADGGAPLAIPVTVNVAAAAAWGVGCMLLGLFTLALINLFTGEGTVKTRLHGALQARQDIHTALEDRPASQRRAGMLAAMDQDFDTAIAILGERHPISIVDHRGPEAEAHLTAARAAAATLTADMAGQRRGAAEIADLRQEWSDLKATLAKIGALGPQAADTPAPDFAGKLNTFLLRYQARFLQGPMAALSDETGTAFGRMELADAAGEGDAARDTALNTRRWLRRSARQLNTNLGLYRAAIVASGWMLITDRVMRDRALHDDLTPDARQRILTRLDAAVSQMDGAAWLPQWGEAHRLLNAAWTEQVRGASETLLRQVHDALGVSNQRTDTTDVEDLSATLGAQGGHPSPEAKQASLRQILALWQAHVAGLDDPAQRATLQGQLDAVTALVDAQAFDKLSPAYHAVVDGWLAWGVLDRQRAIDRVNHPHCLEHYADTQRTMAAVEASLREMPPGPRTGTWDVELDRLRVDMQRQGPDSEVVGTDCLTPLLDLSGRANALSADIFTAGIADVDLPASTRLRLARESGVEAAIATTLAQVDHARTLDLKVVTPEAERIVGRILAFTVERRDPVWGASTVVTVDFGDHTPAFRASAEHLRAGASITHAFTSTVTQHLTVRAEEAGAPGKPVEVLGEGEATVLVAPSPLTAAQRLADAFINARFGLALLVALTVYYWRYHNRTTVFGARGFDYVEAFALGFAADLAVDKLSDRLADFVPK